MKANFPLVILSILSLVAIGCNTGDDMVFPEVKSLAQYKQTTFLPTLETKFDTKSNGIYAASLLMAWDEIKNEISEPLENFNSKDLAFLNSSDSYKNVLSSHEYSSSVEVDDSTVRAKASFRKSLPFIVPIQKDINPLPFLDDKVISFGFYGHSKASKILYYSNDNDFAIKLNPVDEEHEIILIKSTFRDSLILLSEVIRLGNCIKHFEETRSEENDWKYYYNEDDQVRIPIIEFNIETNYSEMEGSHFSTHQGQKFNLELAYQRTGFVLNEKGAEVESEAEVYATEEMFEEDLPKPKNMTFDKPYLILLKRKDSVNPYFAMYVSNSELMMKS